MHCVDDAAKLFADLSAITPTMNMICGNVSDSRVFRNRLVWKRTQVTLWALLLCHAVHATLATQGDERRAIPSVRSGPQADNFHFTAIQSTPNPSNLRLRAGYLNSGGPQSLSVAWEAGEWVVLDADGNSVAEKLIEWGRLVENVQPTLVIDAGEVIVDFLSLNSEQITVGRDPYGFSRRPLWREESLDRENVRGFVFQWPTDQRARDELRVALRQVAAADRIWLDDGEYFDGTLAQSLGEQGRVTAIQVHRGGRVLEIPLPRVRAVRFHGSIETGESGQGKTEQGKTEQGKTGLNDVPPSHLGFQDGTSFLATQIELVDENLVQLKDGSGVTLRLPHDVFLRALCFYRPPRSDVQWLGSVQPLDVVHVPFLTGQWSLGRDENLWGGRLRHGSGYWYDCGLAMHSTMRAAFELSGEQTRFQARLALDQSAGTRGSVRYRVFSRDSPTAAWTSVFHSDIVRGGQEPVEVDVDLGTARQLALIVEFADDGDVLDRALWLSARLIGQ
jgi:hypothetical protein